VDDRGESAGAQSVGSQLLAFGGIIFHAHTLELLLTFVGRDDGIFRAAIAESGGPAVDYFYSAGPGYVSLERISAFSRGNTNFISQPLGGMQC